MITLKKDDLNNLDIECIWIEKMDKEGFGGRPSTDYVCRLPNSNVYVTAKSIKRIKSINLKNEETIKGYKIDRYRIGNVNGYIGETMLHGQYPGQNVYILGQKQIDKDEYKL